MPPLRLKLLKPKQIVVKPKRIFSKNPNFSKKLNLKKPQALKRPPAFQTAKMQNIFHNLPVAEIKLNRSSGTLAYTRLHNGKPRTVNLKKTTLLNNRYFEKSGLLTNILESEIASNSKPLISLRTKASKAKRLNALKRQKVIDIINFLDIKYLNRAGIELSVAKKHFPLSEIITYGGYHPEELEKHFSRAQLQRTKMQIVKKELSRYPL